VTDLSEQRSMKRRWLFAAVFGDQISRGLPKREQSHVLATGLCFPKRPVEMALHAAQEQARNFVKGL
jgi:hypothetical protein